MRLRLILSSLLALLTLLPAARAAVSSQLNIQSFGASPDIADNVAAFNRAITNNRSIYIPQGAYKLLSPLIYTGLTNLTLYGDGSESILSQSDSGNGHSYLIFKGCSNIVIRNLKLDGRASRKSSAIDYLGIALDYSTNCTVENVTFYDLGQNTTTPGGSGMVIEGVEGFGPAWGNVVRNCLFDDSTHVGKFGIRLFTDWTLPIEPAAFTAPTRDNSIINCTFIGWTWNSLEIAGPATLYNMVSHCIANQHYGYNPFDADKGASYNTFDGCAVNGIISDPLKDQYGYRDQGWPDGPVRIAKGNRFLNCSVNGLTLNGNVIGGMLISDAEATVVDGLNVSGLSGSTNSANIRGVSISWDNAITGTYTGPRIVNCMMTNVSLGVVVASLPNASLNNMLVENNTIYASLDGYYSTATFALTNVVIRNNNIFNCGSVAILLRNEQNFLVTHNNLKSALPNSGISIFDAATGDINFNSIRMPSGTAIAVYTNNQHVTYNNIDGGVINFPAGARGNNYGNRVDTSQVMTRYDSAAPVSGTTKTADLVWNTAPTAGGYMGWTSTSDGTPGFQNPFGLIANTDNSMEFIYGMRVGNYISLPIKVKSTNYSILSSDIVIAVDTRTNAVQVTLPSLFNGQEGRHHYIYDLYGTAATNNITIFGSGTNLVNGAASYTISANYGGVMMLSSGDLGGQWNGISGGGGGGGSGPTVNTSTDYIPLWDGSAFGDSPMHTNGVGNTVFGPADKTIIESRIGVNPRLTLGDNVYLTESSGILQIVGGAGIMNLYTTDANYSLSSGGMVLSPTYAGTFSTGLVLFGEVNNTNNATGYFTPPNGIYPLVIGTTASGTNTIPDIQFKIQGTEVFRIGTNGPVIANLYATNFTTETFNTYKSVRTYQSLLTHAGTTTLNFDDTTTDNQMVMTGACTIAFSNLATNRTYNLMLVNNQATNCALTLPAGMATVTNWFFGAPTTVTAGRVMQLAFKAWGATDDLVKGTWAETQ